MGIEFRFKDFAYPLSLLKLKKVFDRNQWSSQEALNKYRLDRLKLIIRHAYDNIPYYKRIFDEKGLTPADIKEVGDLKHIPFLTKDIVRKEFKDLSANNIERYRPQLTATSGTTGETMSFYTDKTSNILEFAYYWRLWGWYGYKLGDVFAELSAEYFMRDGKMRGKNHYYDALTRRLLINAFTLCAGNVEEYRAVFQKYRPKFLKGLASNLLAMALLLNEREKHSVSFKAVFSQGENLYEYQRNIIEEAFQTGIADCYGHMERAVAISQCPEGTYHVHADYGIAEFAEPAIPIERPGHLDTAATQQNASVKEIVGTSLYNFAMPLIRYRTGDQVYGPDLPRECPCERSFPGIVSIIGRDSDLIVTPEGKIVTALYVALNHTPGVLRGQFIQNDERNLIVKVELVEPHAENADTILTENVRSLVGGEMNITIEHVKFISQPAAGAQKAKVVVSKIPREEIMKIALRAGR